MFRRYSTKALKQAMDDLRAATQKPVATTEVIDAYYTRPELVEWCDFLAVNAHPFFHGKRDPATAVDWTLAAWNRLRVHVPFDKPIIFKEVGLPTRGQAGLSEQAQNEYYSMLRGSDVRFVYFEAFDALFKQGPLEQSWGLFHADRSPKPAAALLLRQRREMGLAQYRFAVDHESVCYSWR
jgi:exo-beta-1,3-glucanase (GH17 family)